MKRIIPFIILIATISCRPDEKEKKYTLVITDIPSNIKDLNTEYDDYNSDLNYPHERTEIYFSSNRNSQGGTFDIVAKNLDFSYHAEDDVLNLSIGDEPSESVLILPKVNTDSNEYGPYTFYSGYDMIFMYASNIDSKYNTKFVVFTNWNYAGIREQTVSDPRGLSGINSYGDNLYPSISGDSTSIYFCSNYHDSVFNIYKADYGTPINANQLDNNNSVIIEKDSILSGKSNDKCPFVNKNLMVFVSDREGGYGGFDLWYSYYNNGVWSEPVNFGEKINSEYNEYRPVAFTAMQGYQSNNFDVMIFSSDRPGGKGGFDLYVVKIDNMIK